MKPPMKFSAYASGLDCTGLCCPKTIMSATHPLNLIMILVKSQISYGNFNYMYPKLVSNVKVSMHEIRIGSFNEQMHICLKQAFNKTMVLLSVGGGREKPLQARTTV